MVLLAKRRQRQDVGFGRRLRELREKAGLTQTELGEKAGGMAHQTIAKYERGVSEPSWSVALRLADALGVSLDTLRLTGEAPPEPPPSPHTGKK